MKKIYLASSLLLITSTHADPSLIKSPFIKVKGGNVVTPEPNKKTKITMIKVKDFEMMKYEVSQEEWLRVMPNNSSYFSRKLYCPKTYKVVGQNRMCPDHPVENINFFDASRFVNALNKKSKKYRYELPSVAQYYMALWGEAKTRRNKKELKIAQKKGFALLATLKDDTQTRPVSSGANQSGEFKHLMGNVWEWSRDLFMYEKAMYAKPYMKTDKTLPVDRDKKRYNGSFFGGHFGVRYIIKESFVESDRPPWSSNMLGLRLVRIKK